MNTRLRLLAISAIILISQNTHAETGERPSSNYLWYETPARLTGAIKGDSNNLGSTPQDTGNFWESEALPIGNGRIGAMVFGGDERERLALNEISLWSGGENPSGGYEYGPESESGQMGAYQPFADLLVDFTYRDSETATTGYTRSLSFEDAVCKISYKRGDTLYTRKVFSSFPDQVIVMECTASKPGSINASLMLKPNHTSTISSSGNTLVMNGTLKNGQKYEARLVVIPKGGRLQKEDGKSKIDVTYENNIPVMDMKSLPSIVIEKADSCLVIIAMATDYEMNHKRNWKGKAPDKRNVPILANAVKKSPSALLEAHVANYKSLYDRCSVSFGKTDPAIAQLPTDKRIQSYKTNPADPELEETVFQYGRYILISSSRPGNLPANLQGLWNDQVAPPWASDYHTNINLQMNYWGAEPTNLSECHLPLMHFFKAMEESCKLFTQEHFKTPSGGKVRGWTVRTTQNIFGGLGWEWNIPASAWYAQHMWDHYKFTNDKAYLRELAYPMMKEICLFWIDHLKELGEGGEGFLSNETVDMKELAGVKAGTLVAPNGWSPEHGPREDGVAHDQQLIWELFTNTISAAKILGIDAKLAAELEEKRSRLDGPRIGKEGNLQEWMIDRLAKTDHRHSSHLYAVYPGVQIDIDKTPELAEAARKSLEWRGTSGDSVRSWTWPWRAAMWARFADGEKAHEMIRGFITHNIHHNMLATHPPMQIDGTLGITGGMSEILLQSHSGQIKLLPAPSKAWPNGHVKGMKARGNISVSFEWKDGKVTGYSLTSPNPSPIKLNVNGETITVTPKRL